MSKAVIPHQYQPGGHREGPGRSADKMPMIRPYPRSYDLMGMRLGPVVFHTSSLGLMPMDALELRKAEKGNSRS